MCPLVVRNKPPLPAPSSRHHALLQQPARPRAPSARPPARLVRARGAVVHARLRHRAVALPPLHHLQHVFSARHGHLPGVWRARGCRRRWAQAGGQRRVQAADAACTQQAQGIPAASHAHLDGVGHVEPRALQVLEGQRPLLLGLRLRHLRGVKGGRRSEGSWWRGRTVGGVCLGRDGTMQPANQTTTEQPSPPPTSRSRMASL